METTLKLTSIRCDLHPPLSAVMYCDHCKSFLCRICAETRPGGRVCASCKKPCREPMPEEFGQLVAQRQKSKDDARLAKEAEARIKDQLDKAKQERDARLKAEFAAKKAAWAQQQQHAAPSGARTLGSNSKHEGVAWSSPASSAAMQGVQVAALAPASSGLATTGTMYQPNGSVPREADPLSKLNEHAYLSVIGKAKSWMMGIGILTLLVHGFFIWYVSDEEQNLGEQIRQAKDARVEQIRHQIKAAVSRDDKRVLEQEMAATNNSESVALALGHGAFFVVKAVLGCFAAVGALLIVLGFLCDPFPRGATTAAFAIYLVMCLIDLAFLRSAGIMGLLFRWMALAALFRGMQAGQTLHKMRVEAGEI